jgi:predicted transcriptional regulator
MTGDDLKRRRLLLGYSIHGLAEILRAQPVSIEAWEAGEALIPAEVEAALALIENGRTNGACDLVIL